MTDEPEWVVMEGPWLRLEGGTLDLQWVRQGAPWWRPIMRRRLRRQAADTAALFVEDWP